MEAIWKNSPFSLEEHKCHHYALEILEASVCMCMCMCVSRKVSLSLKFHSSPTPSIELCLLSAPSCCKASICSAHSDLPRTHRYLALDKKESYCLRPSPVVPLAYLYHPSSAVSSPERDWEEDGNQSRVFLSWLLSCWVTWGQWYIWLNDPDPVWGTLFALLAVFGSGRSPPPPSPLLGLRLVTAVLLLPRLLHQPLWLLCK